MNINSIRSKKLELLAFLDFHQLHVVAIQETKIDSSVATSELFPETCPYSVYRKDRNIHGGGVMLLVHKDISHMPITELENGSESIWVKVFANKTSHFVASWYRPPGSTSEEFQLFRKQLDYIRTHHKGKKLPSAHVPGDFNFKDIDWPDRLSKSDSTLSQSEGQILIDIMNDHGLEQMVHFPTREKNTLDLILTTLPGQFQDVHSPDKLIDHAKAKKTGSSKLRLSDGPDIKLFILVGLGRSFFVCCLAHRGSTVGFFCSSVPVVLFDTPGISRCRSQHISVESSSLLHHSI